MSRCRRLNSKGLSLAFTLVVVVSAFAGPATASLGGTTDESSLVDGPVTHQLDVPNDQLTQTAENVSIWDGAFLTLRPDKTDTRFDAAAAYEVGSPTTFVNTKDTKPNKDLEKNPMYVYTAGSEIPFKFEGVSNDDVIADRDVQLVAAKFEYGARMPDSVSSVATTLTSDENVTSSVVGRTTGTSGTNEFAFTPDESGLWMFAVVTVEDGSQGFSDADNDGNLEANGNVTFAGVDIVPVHEQQSSVDTPPVIKPGKNAKIDVAATGLAGDVSHTVIVLNATDLDRYEQTIDVTNRQDITLETEIGQVNGTTEIPAKTSLMGLTPGPQSFTGSESVPSVFDRFNGTIPQFDTVTTVAPGATVYASAVSKNGPAETRVDVPIPESAPSGEYTVIHVATNQTGTQTVSTRESLLVHQSKPVINVVRGSGTISKTIVTPGTQFEVNVTIENRGTGQGTFSGALKADGTTLTTKRVSVDAGSSETVTYEVSLDRTGAYDLTLDGVTVGTVQVVRRSGSDGYHASPSDDGTYASGVVSFDDTFNASLPDSGNVDAVSITFGEMARGHVIVREPVSVPGKLGRPTATQLSWLELDTPKATHDTQATIQISVSKEALDEFSLDTDELRIERYDAETGQWETLETRVVADDGGQVVLETRAPAHTYFAVTVKRATTTDSTQTTDSTPTDETDSDGTTTTQPTDSGGEEPAEPTSTESPVPGFGVLTALFAFVAIVLLTVRRD